MESWFCFEKKNNTWRTRPLVNGQRWTLSLLFFFTFDFSFFFYRVSFSMAFFKLDWTSISKGQRPEDCGLRRPALPGRFVRRLLSLVAGGPKANGFVSSFYRVFFFKFTEFFFHRFYRCLTNGRVFTGVWGFFTGSLTIGTGFYRVFTRFYRVELGCYGFLHGHTEFYWVS